MKKSTVAVMRERYSAIISAAKERGAFARSDFRGSMRQLEHAIETAEQFAHDDGSNGLEPERVAEVAATIFEARLRRERRADRIASDLQHDDQITAATTEYEVKKAQVEIALSAAVNDTVDATDVWDDIALLARGIEVAERLALKERGVFAPAEIARIAVNWYEGYRE